MKLTQSEFYAALLLLITKIEACGASTELTNAVSLAADIAGSVGNESNPPSEFAAERVKAAACLNLPEAPPPEIEQMPDPAPAPASKAPEAALLKEAANQIDNLRRANESLAAQVRVIEIFGAALSSPPPGSGGAYGVDIAWELRKAAVELG